MSANESFPRPWRVEENPRSRLRNIVVAANGRLVAEPLPIDGATAEDCEAVAAEIAGAAAAPAAAPEPLAAILAEMRADECIPHHIDWAFRIEAAAEREKIEAVTVAATKAVNLTNDKWRRDTGNAAALREALKSILAIEGYGAPWIEAKCIAQKALEGAQCTPPPAQERPQIEQPGGIAAMREALEAVRDAFDSNDFGAMGDHPRSDVLDMADAVRRKVDAALAAPARNCDRTKDEAESAFKAKFGRPWNTAEDELASWLFSPAEGGNKQ